MSKSKPTVKKRRLPRSYIWAAAFTLLIAAWLASGMAPEWIDASSEPDAAPAKQEVEEEQKLFRVNVRMFRSQPLFNEIAVRGRTEANRRVEVRTRTSGIVEKVNHRDGELVEEGELLCQLDYGVREAALAQEKAALESARIDFKAADQLAQQNFGSQTKRASEKARLDAALASVDRMEREIAYTSIKAPITGVLEKHEAELGSFLQVGGHCATIVDLDPLLVVVHVRQEDIGAIKPGMSARTRLITGQRVDGAVSFVAPAADETTRTFRVEVEIPNTDLTLREGVTSEVRFELKSIAAHRLPASVLTLNDDGQIGVRVLESGDRVAFVALDILTDDRDGVWVSGLQDEIEIITVGQDYVLEGQRVEPVRDGGDTSE